MAEIDIPTTVAEVEAAEATFDESAVVLPPSLRDPMLILNRPPLNLRWELGPAHHGGEVPPMWCGDRLLVAVELSVPDGLRGNKIIRVTKWDYVVICATESGWDCNGETWGDWSIEDVSWFIRLDKPVTKEQVEACE